MAEHRGRLAGCVSLARRTLGVHVPNVQADFQAPHTEVLFFGRRGGSTLAAGLDHWPSINLKRTSLRRVARREDLALAPAEFALLRRLTTPQKIQTFLNAIPINHELDGETIHSVRSVMRHRRAHCIEGAMFAACALWVNGEPPLVMHLDCSLSDYPHVVALFRRRAHWGAISKTNGASLRYRDPIYRSLRELALSYFHEYSDTRGRKTLRSYSPAFDLRRIDPQLWVANGDDCQEVEDRLAGLRHYPLISVRQQRWLARRDPFERKASKLVEHARPDPKRRKR